MANPIMRDLVNDVLTELRFGAGTDVQIHLQDGIRRNISRCYRTLMKEFVWRDWYIVTQAVIDASTGQLTTDPSSYLVRFSDILAIYLENSADPLPFAPALNNPSRSRNPVIVKAAAPQIFTIWPKKAANVILITRKTSEVDFQMDDEVPFYRDLLSVCTAHQLSVKAGTNMELTQELYRQYVHLVDIYRMSEFADTYQMNETRGSFPTEWYDSP